ncbi:MAG: GerMN domain-containing protein [Treponema sp.]|nr:GerMN domain-containing protein [Treponema sp.]
MAVRKTTGSKAPAKRKVNSTRSWVLLFWLAFVIFLFGLFIFNREAITRGFETIQNEIAVHKSPEGEPVPLSGTSPVERDPPRVSARETPPAQRPEPRPEPAQRATQPAPVPTPAPAPRETPAPQPAPRQVPVQPAPAVLPTAVPIVPQNTAPQSISPQPGPELRERAVYFSQVDRGGSILRVKVSRRLPVSDSPMTDAIRELIAGPSADEKNQGLISLIPPGTRILSATVRGTTAYISFSEDFQYNSYGVEGYAGQLRQVIFTATEFSNVNDVQILIEGRRIDYLGEGVWIGSPLGREAL